MEAVTAAKINIVKEKPLKTLCPLTPNANEIKKKTRNGPAVDPFPISIIIADINNDTAEKINKIL